jgi:hypothetical protein
MNQLTVLLQLLAWRCGFRWGQYFDKEKKQFVDYDYAQLTRESMDIMHVKNVEEACAGKPLGPFVN